jgi:hypothetical protein
MSGSGDIENGVVESNDLLCLTNAIQLLHRKRIISPRKGMSIQACQSLVAFLPRQTDSISSFDACHVVDLDTVCNQSTACITCHVNHDDVSLLVEGCPVSILG